MLEYASFFKPTRVKKKFDKAGSQYYIPAALTLEQKKCTVLPNDKNHIMPLFYHIIIYVRASVSYQDLKYQLTTRPRTCNVSFNILCLFSALCSFVWGTTVTCAFDTYGVRPNNKLMMYVIRFILIFNPVKICAPSSRASRV